MKNPLLSSPDLVKKRQFCQNYNLLWVKNSIRCQFFPSFHKKSLLSCPYHVLSKKRPFSKKHTLLSFPYFVKKNVNSLKITMLSCPYFLKKTSILSEKLCSYVVFFHIFHEKPLLPCPHLVKINSILSK